MYDVSWSNHPKIIIIWKLIWRRTLLLWDYNLQQNVRRKSTDEEEPNSCLKFEHVSESVVWPKMWFCFLKVRVHMDKNLVVQLGTTWLCDIKCVVVVWMVGATCVMRHFRLYDQDREPPNVGPLQKKFVRHNGLTKMLCAVWCNLNIFSAFFT